jgi:tetratricopeptide (TPR) repeat protein
MKTLQVFNLLLFIAFQTKAQEINYQKVQADEYFQMGRYNDAFFIYLDLKRSNPDFVKDFKNASHAMFLTKKVKDYRGFKKYELAKSHLRELIELNPIDPNRSQLPEISIEQAWDYQRYALRQQTIDGMLLYFDKAIEYYNEAIAEGSTDDSLETTIALCRWAKSEVRRGERRTFESAEMD